MITSKRFCNIKTLSISTTLSYDQPHMQRYVKSDTSLSLSLAGVRVSAAGTDLINVHVHWSCRRSLEESLATQRKSWSKRQTKTRNKACLRHLDIHDLVSALSLSLSLPRKLTMPWFETRRTSPTFLAGSLQRAPRWLPRWAWEQPSCSALASRDGRWAGLTRSDWFLQMRRKRLLLGD